MRNIRTKVLASIILITSISSGTQVRASDSPEGREPGVIANTNSWSLKTIPLVPPTKYWQDVAKCQAEVNNDVKRANQNAVVGKYLSIPIEYWIQYGGTNLAASPDLATRQQQITVANRIAVLGWTTTDELGNSQRVKPKGFKFTHCVSKTFKTLKNYTKRVRVSLPDSPEKYCPKWEHLFEEQGLPVKVFSYIAWRESRCQPKAIGWNYHKGKTHKDCKLAPYAKYKKCSAVKSYDSGLLQINSSWRTLTAQICQSKPGDLTVLQDPYCNVKVAKYLYENTSGRLGNWSIKTHKA